MTQHVAHRRSDEIHELRAEIERLRAALEKMANTAPMDYSDQHFIDMARKALEPTPP